MAALVFTEQVAGPGRRLNGRPGRVAKPLKILANSQRSADRALCGTKSDRQRRGFPHALRGPSEPRSTCYCVATLAENFRPIIDGQINPTRFRLFKAFVGGRLMLDKKSYAASRGFIASLVRSRLACRPRSIATTLCGWTSAPTGCSNGSTTAAFSPRARSGTCEAARARLAAPAKASFGGQSRPVEIGAPSRQPAVDRLVPPCGWMTGRRVLIVSSTPI